MSCGLCLLEAQEACIVAFPDHGLGRNRRDPQLLLYGAPDAPEMHNAHEGFTAHNHNALAPQQTEPPLCFVRLAFQPFLL